jgi:hypothetical protein
LAFCSDLFQNETGFVKGLDSQAKEVQDTKKELKQEVQDTKRDLKQEVLDTKKEVQDTTRVVQDMKQELAIQAAVQDEQTRDETGGARGKAGDAAANGHIIGEDGCRARAASKSQWLIARRGTATPACWARLSHHIDTQAGASLATRAYFLFATPRPASAERQWPRPAGSEGA